MDSNDEDQKGLTEQVIRDVFHFFDKDGNGYLTGREFRTAVEDLALKFEKEEVDSMTKFADIDGDNHISIEEFVKLLQSRGTESSEGEEEELTEEEIGAIFRVWDGDGNGYLTADEFRTAVERDGENFTKKEIDEFLRECDADGNDQVSIEEFVKFMRSTKIHEVNMFSD